MRRFLSLISAVALFSACNQTKTDEQIIARVGEEYMTFEELVSAIPNDLSPEDSTELAENLIQNWMNRQLMYDKALYNLGAEQKEIEDQVEKYRKELFIFEYEKELVNQKLDTSVSMSEVETFYEENQDIFQLNDYILKVRYMKLKPNSPELDEVELWMKSDDLDNQDLLMDYCHKYAVSCFKDTSWVYLNELLRQLPIEVYNKESFLRTGNFVHFNDPENLYLLYIRALKSKNTLSPIELEVNRIKSLILNKRKIELLGAIRRSLYRDATRNGKAEKYDKPQVPK
ncbi:MAG: hypothetical protein R2813_09320 [Flavobacteriales bacterium]